MADASPSNAPQGNQAQGAFNPAAGFLNAEARRTLTSPVYSSSGSSTTSVPRDTCIKYMYLKLTAQVVMTWTTGTCTFSEQGVFSRLCSNVEVMVNGNRLIKSVSPHLARLHNILLGGMARRAVSATSAANTVTRASSEWLGGALPFPTTAYYSVINEGFQLNFENPLGYGGSRQVSELDIRDVASCDIRFSWQNSLKILADGIVSDLANTVESYVVTPQIIENRARPRPQPGDVLFDYVETYFARTYSGAARSQQIELQTGNFLMGLSMYVRNGGTLTPPADNLLTNIALMINGSTAIQGPVSQQDLQDANVSRYNPVDIMGLSDCRASTAATILGAHPLKGFAFMNLIRNGDWNTAINTSRNAGTDSIKLQFDTAATTGLDPASYTTNPLEVTLHTHEMRPYSYSR